MYPSFLTGNVHLLIQIELFIEIRLNMSKIRRIFRQSIRGRNAANLRTWSITEDLETINFLQDMKYFTQLRKDFPKVKIDVFDVNYVRIQEKRCHDQNKQFDEVIEKYRKDLSILQKESVAMGLGETNIWDIIVRKEAQNYIQDILVQEKIGAKVLLPYWFSDNKIKIVEQIRTKISHCFKIQ
jgi:hypothetical protein